MEHVNKVVEQSANVMSKILAMIIPAVRLVVKIILQINVHQIAKERTEEIMYVEVLHLPAVVRQILIVTVILLAMTYQDATKQAKHTLQMNVLLYVRRKRLEIMFVALLLMELDALLMQVVTT